ncbi:MAG: RluA family pseudouridine synthase [Deltaproteobacteria bacterium]|nr:RluA family pseudouridine synthase [Deltaproteobacteria bacterium]
MSQVSDERKLRVPQDGEPDRLDRWLPKLLGISRGEARRLIDAGGVYVNGKRCRQQSRHLEPGVELACVMGAHAVAIRAKKGPEPVIVYRDDALIVIDKPAGMPAQASRATVHGTAEQWVKQLPRVSYVALHHRLDRDAQGLLAFGVDRRANKGLSQAFGERLARRSYRALVEGHVDGELGTWHHSLQEMGRSRRAVAFSPEGGKEMLSDWCVTERGRGSTMLQVSLRTGRTHQIRLQAQAVGHSIVGDTLYGTKDRGGLHLQAFALALDHPVTGEPLSFELPAPAGWSLTTGAS